MSFRFILKTIIIFIGLIFCLPVVALAAEVRINPAVTTVAVDSQVAVSVDIDNVENLFAVSLITVNPVTCLYIMKGPMASLQRLVVAEL